jgi:hypothetical protein
VNHQKIKEHLRVNSNVFKYIFQSVSPVSYPTGYRPAFCLSNQRGQAGIIELLRVAIEIKKMERSDFNKSSIFNSFSAIP